MRREALAAWEECVVEIGKVIGYLLNAENMACVNQNESRITVILE